MQKNGFYAAMKTDEGVQAIYIDEGMTSPDLSQLCHAKERVSIQSCPNPSLQNIYVIVQCFSLSFMVQ